MKYLIIGTFIAFALLFISQVWARNESSGIETLKYEVLKKFDGFEIRKYEPANYTYVTMSSQTYKESSGTGFRTLAGYIFGSNEDNQKIAMTSPVEIEMKDSVTMKFMVPSEYSLEELPLPNDGKVKFKQEGEKTVAAIVFGGWANDTKIKEHTEKLKALLKKNNIKHSDKFSFLGYNSPFEILNRRNEIIVEVELN